MRILVSLWLLFSASAFATQYKLTSGCLDCFNFVAPGIYGASNVGAPQSGLIVFDTFANRFVGYSPVDGWQSLTNQLGIQNTRSVTSTGSTTANDTVVFLSGSSFTLTLHTAVGNTGQVLELLHNGTSLTQVYTLNTTSSQTIGGVTSGNYALYTKGENLKLISDGSNWLIQDHKAETGWSTATTNTITGSGGNPTKPTTMQADKIIWRRSGKTMHVHISMYATSTTGSSAGTGAYLWLVPGSQAIDTTDLTSYSTFTQGATNAQQAASSLPGSGWFASAQRGQLVPQLWDSTHFGFLTVNSNTVEVISGAGNTGFNAASVWGLSADVSLPISGWQP